MSGPAFLNSYDTWTASSSNVNQLILDEQGVFPLLDAIQALNPADHPAVVIVASLTTPGQGTPVGAAITVGGYSCAVVAACYSGAGGGGTFQNVILGVLPVTSSMTFTSSETIITIPGMGTGGPPYVYGAGTVALLYNNVDPASDWSAGSASADGAPLLSISVAATAQQLAVAAWSNSAQAGTQAYTITAPSSDYEASGRTGLAAFGLGSGLVPTSGTYDATATYGGGPFSQAVGIVGLLNPPPPVSVPNVVGDTLSVAEAAITAASLAVGAVSSAPNGAYAAGLVYNQIPGAGTLAPTGTSVDLFVSLGSSEGILYGKFSPVSAFPPICFISEGLIEPRVWIPRQNNTVRV